MLKMLARMGKPPTDPLSTERYHVLMETAPIRMSPAGFRAFMAALSGPATAVPEIVELFQRPAPWEARGSKTAS